MPNQIGCLVIDIEGTQLSAEDKDVLTHPLVGGFILFARNYESPSQLSALVKSIRTTKKSPILIMVDQEGGRVQRFKDGFTRLPPAASFGEIYAENPDEGIKSARLSGKLMASEILAAGIDFSIAPVLDLNKPICKVIGDRAFHHTTQGVIELATAYMHGMREAGMASIGKHFPGHGSVSVDSHTGMPVDERTFAELEQEDLYPFTALIQRGIDAILASHVIFPAIDKMPAGYSRYWLTDILRNKLKFNGPILTDDLSMEGANISSNYAERVTLAREAGCDLALLCNSRAGVAQVLDNVSCSTNSVPYEKWHVLKGNFINNLVVDNQ